MPVARSPTVALVAPKMPAVTPAETPAPAVAHTLKPAVTPVAPAAAVTALHSARELLAVLSAGLSTPGATEAVSVVQFHAPSCRSCAGVRVKYERMAAAYATGAPAADVEPDPPSAGGGTTSSGPPTLPAAVACYAMDVSPHAELCTRLGVEQLPYFMVIRGGRRTFARAVGWNRFDDVRAAVDTAVHALAHATLDEATPTSPAQLPDADMTADAA